MTALRSNRVVSGIATLVALSLGLGAPTAFGSDDRVAAGRQLGGVLQSFAPGDSSVGAGGSVYTHDPENPGWAYGENVEEAHGWVRLDLRGVGLAGPPTDPLDRGVYVVDRANPGAASTGDAAQEANWISVLGLGLLVETVEEAPLPEPTSEPVIPASTATLRPAPPSSPQSSPTSATVTSDQPPSAGVYDLARGKDLVSRFAGAVPQRGLFFPLSFPEDWRGRSMKVNGLNTRYESSDDGKIYEAQGGYAKLIWSPTFPRAGDSFAAEGCPKGPRPSTTCWLGDANTASGWLIEPGRYFLFFQDSEYQTCGVRTCVRQSPLLYQRFRLDFTR